MSWLRTWQESVARRELATLANKLEAVTADLAVNAAWLQAAIDQHAAAIRDILTMTGGTAGPIEIAGYSDGVLDAAANWGWRTPTAPGNPDWVIIRLLAACSLASQSSTARSAALPAP
jgi:hypothetical protein